jgi:AbrB family looped-hinge helix DNA binding protein
MKLAKVTTSGRVTIPLELRKKYGLHPGRKVRFVLAEEGIRIIPFITPEEIKTNAGFLETKGKLLKALIKVKKIGREL